MCGIAGIYNYRKMAPAQNGAVETMIASLRHRGPDETGFHVNGPLALGSCRLSIIDISGGTQPIYNEDGTVCVVFNGEIFNYIELRDFLVQKGHVFKTKSDTEVIVHLFEEYGPYFMDKLNGQFAIALWDSMRRELHLVRDRVGIVPLFFAQISEGIVFASEMKALFAEGSVSPEFSEQGLEDILTMWVNIPPMTPYKVVREVEPGGHITVSPRGCASRRYWDFTFPDDGDYDDAPVENYIAGLNELIYDAVSVRLRADVPVASYLSGGLDSSIISMIAGRIKGNSLRTFSVTFDDSEYDESSYQELMAGMLKTEHSSVRASLQDTARAFEEAVWFGERPLTRSAPAPLYLLSGLVRENGLKVVLTGEGADEIFGGYNIFKEDRIRRFWAKVPSSHRRPKLLSTLYPYITRDPRVFRFWQSFFKYGLEDTDNPYYSHTIRWKNTSSIKHFIRPEIRELFSDTAQRERLDSYISPDISRWNPLCRAQYIESKLFLPGYLLSSQGDRVLMGHSVEGRFPFLDHRVIEYAASIPPRYKLNVLNEKYILKRAFEGMLPDEVCSRSKQPYRAPIAGVVAGLDGSARESCSEENIRSAGVFEEAAAINLLRKAENPDALISERDDMALAAISSTQMLYYMHASGAARGAAAAARSDKI